MKTFIPLLIAVGALAVGPGPQAAAAEEAQATTVMIDGQAYTVISDEEVRNLGFDVPDVKPEDNAAYDYINAINAYHSIERGDPLDRLRDQVMREGWTEEAGPLAEYIERNAKALEWIRLAAAKDVCHFPMLVSLGSSLDETSPAGILLLHLAKLRELARLLVTVGKACEYEAEFDEALNSYLLIIQLGNHAAQEPILISGLVGVACSMMGASAIEQCLVGNEIDETILADAQKRLATLAVGRPSAVVTMRGEGAWSASIIEHMIKHPAWLAGYVESDTGMGKLQHAAFLLMLKTEKGRAQIRADVREFWEAMDKAVEMPLPEFIETGAGDKPVREAKARKMPPNIMGLLGPALSRARSSYARNDLAWTVLDVELALARYRAEHDEYPELLDAVKDLMLGGGLDPFSGKPLGYRIEDDGSYTIWSVGENLVDDGGAVGLSCPDWRADDYVWNSEVIHGG